LQSEKICRFIVGPAVSPAAIDDAQPFERERTDWRVVRLSFLALLAVLGVGPAGAADRRTGPLDDAPAQEIQT